MLDASVLIGYLDREDTHHRRAESLLEREIDDDFAASALTLAEVLVAPARQNRVDAVRAALEDLAVRELALPADAAVKLAQLRVSTQLRMPDCGVLLAAEEEQARVASFDDRLIDAAALRRLATVTD